MDAAEAAGGTGRVRDRVLRAGPSLKLTSIFVMIRGEIGHVSGASVSTPTHPRGRGNTPNY